MTTKRGLNLGCGTIILPCAQPEHHALIPADIYTDPAIAWDNADRNTQPGVNLVFDAFDVPWRTADGVLPDNTYDVAIVAHLAEHIPHLVIRNGQVMARDEEYQDGWFAFWGELYRVMKPGGVAEVLVPYAWSNGGISDPTHTRYLTPATFNYFNNAFDDNSPFRYKVGSRWLLNIQAMRYRPHVEGMQILMDRFAWLRSVPDADRERLAMGEIWGLAQRMINAVPEFAVTMEAIK